MRWHLAWVLGGQPKQQPKQLLKALYGLNTSPKDWGCHRDKTMASFGWRVNDVDFNLWAIKEVEFGAAVGNIVVYVDDMLVAAKEGVMKGFMQRLQQEWKTSAPEVVEGSNSVTFCGMEICEKEGGFGWGSRRISGTWWEDTPS